MIGRWLLAGRCLIAAVVGVALSMWLSAQSRPSALQRGGVDEFGPYDVVPNWYKPVQTGWIDAETEEWILGRTPLGRLGTPTDAANVVAFLCSAQGGWINGQLLHSDGGF